MNPILVREVRARLRGRRDPALLFGYAALLALATVVIYATTSPVVDTANGGSFSRQTGRIGHDLFVSLSVMQMLGWMLLGAAITATSIAGEREGGLLDMLQLTPMTPRRIAQGKLLSSISFFGLLMLAPLPVTAICFLMGGVSPGEFCVAFVLQAATALLTAAIGLFASAWCRRASTALGLAYGIMAAWAVGGVFVYMAHDARWWWAYSRFNSEPIARLLAIGGDFFWRTNPIISFVSRETPWTKEYFFPIAVPDWVLSVAFQVVASAVLMWSVGRALRHPLPDAPEAESANPRGLLRNVSVKTRSSVPAHEYSSVEAEGAGRDNAWWEWARVANVRLANPVLEREVRRRGRMRRPAPWLRQMIRLALLALVIGYVWGLCYVLSDPGNRREVAWWMVAVVGMAIAMCAAASLGAVAFAREREAGTWQGIQLSLLRPRQIVWGKAIPPFLACAAFSLLWWTLMLPCVSQVVTPQHSYYRSHRGASLTQACGTLLIALSTCWAYVCWGVFVSWWCRRLWAAVVWSIASLLLVLVLIPTLLLVSAHGSQSDLFIFHFLRFWHPLFAVACIAEPPFSARNQLTVTPIALSYAVTLGAFGLFLLLTLEQSIAGMLHGDAAMRRHYTSATSPSPAHNPESTIQTTSPDATTLLADEANTPARDEGRA